MKQIIVNEDGKEKKIIIKSSYECEFDCPCCDIMDTLLEEAGIESEYLNENYCCQLQPGIEVEHTEDLFKNCPLEDYQEEVKKCRNK